MEVKVHGNLLGDIGTRQASRVLRRVGTDLDHNHGEPLGIIQLRAQVCHRHIERLGFLQFLIVRIFGLQDDAWKDPRSMQIAEVWESKDEPQNETESRSIVTG